ncbi:hypothetical protein PTW37_17175 (plasmid) [Arthrobacter agilis]|uniref:hypothetical protein n=1 Tax=Arthrobacter agilis TaxID=37921 RepID=UPI00236661F5|nr:hypothetical protein [Arthrobacter agilis]WDF35206.1 hypothetical protein PTW37_17175 [Arthrobacter agilis]
MTAIIVGVLAMHVWMGGHGSTTHHVPTPTTVSTVSTAGGNAGHAVGGPGHTHDGAGSTVAEALTPVAATAAVDAIHAAATDVSVALVSSATSVGAVDGGMLAGCGGDCADEMMLGMCVLAMIVAGIAWLLTPAGRALLSTVIRRGPPVLTRLSRPAPAPSLTQLCISRT